MAPCRRAPQALTLAHVALQARFSQPILHCVLSAPRSARTGSQHDGSAAREFLANGLTEPAQMSRPNARPVAAKNSAAVSSSSRYSAVANRVHKQCVRSAELPRILAHTSIDWRTLRALRLDQVEREVDQLITDEVASGRLGGDALRSVGARARKAPTPREQYAQAAAQYVRLCGKSKSPLRDLAAQLHISYSAARDDIREARRLGFLTKTARGVRGGQLTELAIAVLSGTESGSVSEG
jgi:hypothetical protein